MEGQHGKLDSKRNKMCWKLACLVLSLWLSGLICLLSHSTCWALLADDLWWSGFKSRSGREVSVGWTNSRYAMRLISRTGTEGPPVSSLNCDRCRFWSYDIYGGIEMWILLLLLLLFIWWAILAHKVGVRSQFISRSACKTAIWTARPDWIHSVIWQWCLLSWRQPQPAYQYYQYWLACNNPFPPMATGLHTGQLNIHWLNKGWEHVNAQSASWVIRITQAAHRGNFDQ